MNANNLYLQRCFPELLTGCCPSSIYCHVFNWQDYALLNTAGSWALSPFHGASSQNFAIPMVESADRSRSYSALLTPDSFSLPDTPDGEFYEIEFWRLDTGSAPTYLRANSTFLAAEKFIWYDQKMMTGTASLGGKQRSSGGNYYTNVSLSFNSETGAMQIMAWLELDGVTVQDASGVQVTMVDAEGAVKLDSTSHSAILNNPGVFCWSVTGVTLVPDTNYYTIVTGFDADNNPHTTTGATIVWN